MGGKKRLWRQLGHGGAIHVGAAAAAGAEELTAACTPTPHRRPSPAQTETEAIPRRFGPGYDIAGGGERGFNGSALRRRVLFRPRDPHLDHHTTLI